MGNNEKMEIFFIVQCVKKMSLRKKVENGAKKRHKTCVALFFLLSLQKKKKFQRTIHIYNNL